MIGGTEEESSSGIMMFMPGFFCFCISELFKLISSHFLGVVHLFRSLFRGDGVSEILKQVKKRKKILGKFVTRSKVLQELKKKQLKFNGFFKFKLLDSILTQNSNS